MFKRVACILAIHVLAGCASAPELMPTPNVVSQNKMFPTDQIPEALRNSFLDIIYVTDRAPIADSSKQFGYGSQRSASIAYGSAQSQISPVMPWQNLHRMSLESTRDTKLTQKMLNVTELGVFPPTPYPFTLNQGKATTITKTTVQIGIESNKLKREIRKRLVDSQRKEIILFVHGFNNSFEDSIFTLSGIWHFLGRQGVPISYSWPADHGGVLGYIVDRESGEFTIYHLKETLKILFSMPEIERIHIIAHSRGSDVTTTALREMMLESRAKGQDVKKQFRIANLILAAPDLDFGVMTQRLMAEKFGTAIGRITIYTTQSDIALAFAQQLMTGKRFGAITASDLTENQKQIFKTVGNVHIVTVGQDSEFIGHAYFHKDPAVSSDLIRLITTDAEPGSQQRPLKHSDGNFWQLPANYPAE